MQINISSQEKPKYCIYIHINKINNKVYIGQSHNIQKRWMPSNYKGCTKFYNAIQKYGWDNFQHKILIDNLTLEEANKLQEEYIKKYNSIENGYNLKSGGLNNIYTKESRQKMREARKGKDKKIICIETKKIYLNGMDIEKQLGFKQTNIISCCQGKLCTAYNYHWEYYDDNKNYDNYTPQKQDKRKKKIYCKELNKIFESAAQASRETKIARPNISKCCNNKLNTAGGYHWEYYQE